MKKKIVEIKIGFTEAGDDLANVEFKGADAIQKAEAHLDRISNCESNKHPGYCKTDVAVIFEDGYNYEARFDVSGPSNPFDQRDTRIKAHIRDFLTFHAGLRCPAHMARKNYDQYMSQQSAEEIAECRKFLAEYDVDELQG